MTASIRRLGSPAPTIEGLRTVAHIEGAEDVAIRTLWPSEQRTFADAVAGAKAKIAGPVLTQRVDELLVSTTTIAGAQQVIAALDPSRQRRAAMTTTATAVPAGRSAPGRTSPVASPPAAGRATAGTAIDDSLPALMAMTSPDVQQAQTARLEARLAAIADAEAQKDGQALGRLGDGASGLEAGGKWLAEVNRKYGSLASRPAVSALVDDLSKRRGPQFRAGESTVTTRLQAAKTSLEVNAVVGTYLSVPSDRSDPIGGRLLASALQKRDQLQTAEKARREAEVQEQIRRDVERAPRDLPGSGDSDSASSSDRRPILGSGMPDYKKEEEARQRRQDNYDRFLRNQEELKRQGRPTSPGAAPRR
jgi:hypothetical protein